MRRQTTVTYHGIDWTVEGNYLKGEAPTPYEKNGDPGNPGSASDLDDVIIEIICKQGQFVRRSDEMSDILTDAAKAKIIEAALEEFDDPDFAAVPF